MADDPLAQLILNQNRAEGDGLGNEVRRDGEPDSAPNTDDELETDLEDGMPPPESASGVNPSRPGPNTGPKGVVSDRQEATRVALQSQRDRVTATNARMERMALNAGTWQDEEDARKAEQELKEGVEEPGQEAEERKRIRNARLKELQREQQQVQSDRRLQRLTGEGLTGVAMQKAGWFGHLREVNEMGYVKAIDDERPNISIVVHIYAKSVPACAVLTSSLVSLARQYPRTKFLQVRATSIGFGCEQLPPSTGGAEGILGGGSDDTDANGEQDGMAGWHASQSAKEIALEESAKDVLPTLLVYRGGRLVANLVRCDLDEHWGSGEEQDVRNLLDLHDALSSAGGNEQSRSGDEDDDNDDE